MDKRDIDAASEDTEAELAALLHRQMPEPPELSGRFGRAVHLLGKVVATFFLISTAVVLYEIVSRYVFGAPTRWAHETTTFLCACGFLFGGLYALAHDKHIRVVLIYDAVSERVRRWFDVVISTVGLIAVLFFAYAAWATVQRSWFAAGTGEIKLETSGSAFDAPYPALIKGLLLVIVVAMAVQFVIHIVNSLRNARRARADRLGGAE
jgi:TRAP-type C4-dicarboxylate transport system permease small subunit